ncbi:cilia- and flagella-associated protein 70 isoform X3 [Agelaius phoeniceus]|uniref:cilia- and flagella-associated protein 70 isoform X3 n=1 Tax=Agelaius phoeniceus TaxID=39638 RepID=UPI004054E245
MSQPIPVQITVVSAQDLKTLKSNLLFTLVRVEYNGAVLGDSSKTHVLPDGTAEYDFSTSFEYSPDGPNSLDVLVQKPVLLTLLEVASKDKKKTEKIAPLAQAVVDLLPLLQGVRSLKVLAPLYAVPASPSAKLYPEATAGLEVIVSTKELLLSATQFSSGNLLSITLEAAYSVPEAFTADAQQNYMACLQMPAAGEKELPLLFKNGILKADGEKEPFPRPKNWPLGPILAPDALNIPDSFIVGGPYEDEDGELNKSEDKEFRTQAESSRRVVWDMETRCFLDADAVAILQRRIAECRHWPVELCRMSSGGKGKTNKPDKKDEDKPIAFHGVAYVNMMHLLCPGVTQIRGAFRVFNYEDSEVFEKTRVQYSIFRDRRSQLSLGKERLGTSPSSKAAPSKAQKEDSNAMVVEDYHKRVTSVAVAILREYHELFGKQLLDQGVMDHETMEEQKRQLNYELNTSGKYFAFKEQLKYSVVKIVREKYLKTTAFETKEQLQAFLSELYVYLVDHMHMALNKLLSGEDVSAAPPPNTTRKQLLLFAREAEANKDLKLASLFYNQRIARDQHSIQAWLDYGAFCLLYEDATKAQECFQQAVCLDPQHIQSLLLCGIVCVKLQTYEEAEIFFEDACCLEPSSIIAWTLAGLFYELQNNYIQAERSFREAKKLLRAELEEERRILEAAEAEGKKPSSPSTGPEKIPDGSADKPPEVVEGGTPKEEATAVQEAPEAPEPQPPPRTIFMKSVEFLMKFNAVRFVHKALAHELLSLQGGPTCAYYLALGWTYQLRENLPRWEECLREAVRIEPLNPNVWAQKGHLCYLQKDFDKAKDCYERVISFEEDAADMHFVYLRLGSIYLDEKEYGRAKHIYLLACDNSASCLTWLGVGIACYRLEEMLEAEDALSEANALNNTNAEVWGYLALICLQDSLSGAVLQGGRQLEAEQCYKYTVKLGLQNDALLQEIREAQHRFGFGDPSL